MRHCIADRLVAAMLYVCGEALALKERVDVTRKNMGAVGFEVKTVQREDGAVEVNVTRDVSSGPDRDAGGARGEWIDRALQA